MVKINMANEKDSKESQEGSYKVKKASTRGDPVVRLSEE